MGTALSGDGTGTPLTAEERARCLIATPYIECDHPAVVAFARGALAGMAQADEAARAVRLYEAVRDGIPYDAYTFRTAAEVYPASVTVGADRSFCIPKAILLAALARASGIPARLGFADVRNHLSTKRLIELMGTDLFVFHGYTELYVNGRWLKVTPTFDTALCARFGLRPLTFDGHRDALFHPYDTRGARHMEYVRDRGHFDDFPHEALVAATQEAYPHIAPYLEMSWEALPPPMREDRARRMADEAEPL